MSANVPYAPDHGGLGLRVCVGDDERRVHVVVPAGKLDGGPYELLVTTTVDGQQCLGFEIFCGSKPASHENKLISYFELRGLGEQPAGRPRVQVRFAPQGGSHWLVLAHDPGSRASSQHEFDYLRPMYFRPLRDVSQQRVDLVFILDLTRSMGPHLARVPALVRSLAEQTTATGVGRRLALIGFGDKDYGDPFVEKEFTEDLEQFNRTLDDLPVLFGYDEPESALEAVEQALHLPYLGECKKVAILITDASPKTKPGEHNWRMQELAKKLQDAKLQLHIIGPELGRLVAPPPGQALITYRELAQWTGGRFFELNQQVDFIDVSPPPGGRVGKLIRVAE